MNNEFFIINKSNKKNIKKFVSLFFNEKYLREDYRTFCSCGGIQVIDFSSISMNLYLMIRGTRFTMDFIFSRSSSYNVLYQYHEGFTRRKKTADCRVSGLREAT